MEAGLPNIIGYGTAWYNSDITLYSGAIYPKNITDPNKKGMKYFEYQNSPVSSTNVDAFDASRSNPIYGKSDTVQPKAHIVIYWKRVE